MTNSEARKRAQEAHAAAGATNDAPVDSGTIGRLNEAERAALATALPESEWDYDRDRLQFEMQQVVEHLLRENTDRALAEALGDIRARRQEFNRLGAHEQYLMALDDAFGLVNNRLRATSQVPAVVDVPREAMAQAWDEAIHHLEPHLTRWAKRAAMQDNPYRAARQEQGRG